MPTCEHCNKRKRDVFHREDRDVYLCEECTRELRASDPAPRHSSTDSHAVLIAEIVRLKARNEGLTIALQALRAAVVQYEDDDDLDSAKGTADEVLNARS